MCAIPTLGAKVEIKRQRIKFSDSELDLANMKQVDDRTLYGIFRCSLGQRTKVV